MCSSRKYPDPQSNLICNFCLSLALNETDKGEFTLIRASLRFVIRPHGRNVDGITVISCRTSQTYHHKINAKQREE